MKKAHTFGFVFAIFLFATLASSLLALPAQASFKASAQIKRLDDSIVLNFPYPIKREQITVSFQPEIEFSQKWSGVLVNQNLTLTPTSLLQPDTEYTLTVTDIENPLGTSTNNQSFTFKTEPLPKVVYSYPNLEDGRVKPNPVITFMLDKDVNYGSFQLTSSPSVQTEFTKEGRNLLFTPKKPLKQGEEYLFRLKFSAADIGSEKLFEGSFLVVKPLKIVKTTPRQETDNVSKKASLKLKFNKSLKDLFLGSFISVKPSTEVQLEFVNKKTVKITPKSKFKTDTDYKVTVDKAIEATDGANLEQDFVLKINIAGPVSVVSASPTGFGVPLNSTISVTFDQKVSKNLAQEGFSISPNISGSFSWFGDTLTFVPTNNFPLFKTYSFALRKSIKGPGGEPSDKDFTYSFTTTSERQKNIGTSVKGRGITAYYFGVGGEKILLTGALHGSEGNTRSLLLSWVSFLRANQNLIPKDRTFIIVPNANPDGLVKDNRFNARGVDLNRNWNTPTWAKDSYWTYGKVKGGGGSKPFSEPETKALRNLINSENPKITISYHSAAGVIISDGAASNKLRDWYSTKTGYTVVAGAPVPYEDEFSYDVTGSMEEWLGEAGKTVIVVELATRYDSEYLRNLPALKGLLTYSL